MQFKQNTLFSHIKAVVYFGNQEPVPNSNAKCRSDIGLKGLPRFIPKSNPMQHANPNQAKQEYKSWPDATRPTAQSCGVKGASTTTT